MVEMSLSKLRILDQADRSVQTVPEEGVYEGLPFPRDFSVQWHDGGRKRF
jgi:hypothetical protein